MGCVAGDSFFRTWSVARLLLAKVPDQDRWDEGGRAALLWAAGKGYKEVQAFRAMMDTLRPPPPLAQIRHGPMIELL